MQVTQNKTTKEMYQQVEVGSQTIGMGATVVVDHVKQTDTVTVSSPTLVGPRGRLPRDRRGETQNFTEEEMKAITSLQNEITAWVAAAKEYVK